MSQPLPCPICGAPVPAPGEAPPGASRAPGVSAAGGGEEAFPFCSKRCRVSDLARWASGDYKVSRPLTPEERLAAERQAAGEAGDDEDD